MKNSHRSLATGHRLRIFVFGLDGATWKLIDRWVEKGYLPFFEKLIRQGVKRDLISTVPPVTPVAWSSFATGLTPGEHGVFDFIVRKDVFGRQQEMLVNGSWLKGRQFWLQWPEKKIALVNLPLTYPPKITAPKNGLVISSILTPPGKSWFYPHKWANLIEETGYQVEGRGLVEKLFSWANSREKLSYLQVRAEQRFTLAQKLIEKEDWDFFFLLFSETDWVQHLFWRSRQTLVLYRQIDNYLAQIYEILRRKYGARNFYFFLVSDHGFHAAPKVQFNLYPWLRKEGFLPPSTQAFIARILRKASFWQKDKTKSRVNSWGETKKIWPHNFGLYLNKKILGKDYHRYRQKLIERLRGLKYSNGKRVFQLVAPREEVYQGARNKLASDIVWLTQPYFTVGLCSIERKLFVLRTEGIPAIHESDRRGIFLAKGVGIKKFLKDWQENDLYIWDLPKIFNRIFGLPDDKIKKRTGNQKRTKLTKKEEAEIKKRLGALGYL